jgi:hypothetical protein
MLNFPGGRARAAFPRAAPALIAAPARPPPPEGADTLTDRRLAGAVSE